MLRELLTATRTRDLNFSHDDDEVGLPRLEREPPRLAFVTLKGDFRRAERVLPVAWLALCRTKDDFLKAVTPRNKFVWL